MRPVDIIRKKRDGEALSRAEIQAFIVGVTTRTWPEYQTSALLMAIVLRGMNTDETDALRNRPGITFRYQTVCGVAR